MRTVRSVASTALSGGCSTPFSHHLMPRWPHSHQLSALQLSALRAMHQHVSSPFGAAASQQRRVPSYLTSRSGGLLRRCSGGVSSSSSSSQPANAAAVAAGLSSTQLCIAAAMSPAVATYLAQSRRTAFTQSTALRAPQNPKDETPANKSASSGNMLQGYNVVGDYKPPEDEKKAEEEQNEDPNAGQEGYLPFPPPLHTINIMSLLLLGNVLLYAIMNWCGNDELRDTIIDHFTLSHENWWKIYPFFTSAFYQEHLLQLVIDGWLLFQFGNTMLGFLGNKRLTFFWALCMLGGGALHICKQHVELYYGLDPLEVRGHVYGANPFILGLVSVEGLIFRHLNFMQNPPVPFLVLTAFVMVIDVWRIFTMKPDEHGASTGGALVAYVFWALPTRLMGLNKLTAAI